MSFCFLRKFLRLARRLAVVLPLMVVLSACAAQQVDMPRAPEGVVPVAPLATDIPDYRIQFGDVLEIKMMLNPELEQKVVVRPDGMITTMLAQNVRAYGLTPAELQAELIEIYKEQLTDPQLVVVVSSYAPARVYVLGEVPSPGEFVSVGQTPTLLQALSRAGGLKNTAKSEFITILRRGASEKPEIFRANFDEAVTGQNPLADVRLAPNDVVFVPRTAVAEAYKNYEQWFKQFVSTSLSVGANYSINNDD